MCVLNVPIPSLTLCTIKLGASPRWQMIYVQKLFMLILFMNKIEYIHVFFFESFLLPECPYIISIYWFYNAFKTVFLFLRMFILGAGSVAEWLSSRASLQRPRVRILGADMAPLVRPCWGGILHPTTRRTCN